MLRIFGSSLIAIFLVLNSPAYGAWWDCLKIFSVQPKAESKSSRFSGAMADFAYSIKRRIYPGDLQGDAKDYPNLLQLAKHADLSIKDFRKYPGLKQFDEFYKTAAVNLTAKNLGPINYIKFLAQGDRTVLTELETLEKQIADRGLNIIWKTEGNVAESATGYKQIYLTTKSAIVKEPIANLLSVINHELDHSEMEFRVDRETPLDSFTEVTTHQVIEDEVRVRILEAKYHRHLLDVGILKSLADVESRLSQNIMRVLDQKSLSVSQRYILFTGYVEREYLLSTQAMVQSHWVDEQTGIDIGLITDWMKQETQDPQDAYSLLRLSPRRQKFKSLKFRDEYDQWVFSKAGKESGKSPDYIDGIIVKIKAFSSEDPPVKKAKN